ncbi:tetraacyldisaccharide 4'-kinase [Bordetella genomosp. 12]|uniref:Tetraacyldisaccharide 4'-kinase n=1 Tax=Bordetella genomosp. 12 TaxID=463035 RepID=A0A261VLS3_9BORD|nr:tetraacyldisaccharide 4'-kinase [Bordetella genomosp. 12]OZI74462.1 tetraacyldisaccharide 4'-kinase [Bordetella genomosp. 12]
MKLRDRLHRFVQRQWRLGGWLATLLRPLSALTAIAVRRKRQAYQTGRKTGWRAPVPVIVVGNIYVGGTGKTPVVVAVLQGLRARGYTPGMVSRGYGVRIDGPARVGQGTLSAADFGDEPALIAAATAAAVAVHPRRAEAAQALLAAHPEVDVIVADDGLQHLALARDIEIVVQDERGCGNGRLLPAGPLREPPERLDHVDAVITNLNTGPGRAPAQGPARQWAMWLEPGAARRLTDGEQRPLASFAGQPVAAAAGIGNPGRFFRTLESAGLLPTPRLALPDHYDYARSPFAGLRAEAIFITTKDAVKCAAFDDPRLWAVPVSAAFSAPDFLDWLVSRLHALPPR